MLSSYQITQILCEFGGYLVYDIHLTENTYEFSAEVVTVMLLNGYVILSQV
jgi:hypothetical protein